MEKATHRSFYPLDAFVIALILLIGSIHIPWPMGDDQALFVTGAREMNHGVALYRDFWDVKQPGIYMFYLLAGRMFGFDERGPHALDVIYMTAFSAVLIVTLRRYFDRWWTSSLIPLLTVGFYYATTGTEHRTGFFTQVEALVGFPLYLTLWFAWKSLRSPDKRFLFSFCSGLAGAAVVVFKLMFLPIVFLFWVTTMAAIRLQQRDRPALAIAVRATAPWAAGFCIPLLLTSLYFARLNDLQPLLFTSFVYPLQAVHGVAFLSRISALFEGFQWFLGWSAPLLALAAIGAWGTLRRTRDFLTLNLLTWIVAGYFIILIQVLSWWSYHYLLLLVPLGILAGKGTEIIGEQISGFTGWEKRLVYAFSAILLFSPVIGSWIIDGLLLARYRFAMGAENRRKFHEKVDPHYQAAYDQTAFLREPDSLPGDIYVLGSYIYHLVSGRSQAIAMNGESPEELTDEEWSQMDQQLRTKLPHYVFVDKDVKILPKFLASGVPAFLGDKYGVLRSSSLGTWYVVKT